MAWVLVAIIGLATVISFKSARYWVHYGDER
jgi:multiple sugar transport system permease protein